MTKKQKEAIIESLKELGRVILLAIIPVAIDSLSKEGRIDPKVCLVVGLIASLRFIDKLAHEWGKVIKNDTLTKGLTQF